MVIDQIMEPREGKIVELNQDNTPKREEGSLY
jgi:hypothetical protein